MTNLSIQHALERADALRIPRAILEDSYRIVESALGANWLTEQERRSPHFSVPISDAHPLIRRLSSPTDEAHAEICELALYLKSFANDSAISSVLHDIRSTKYEAILLELAFAFRWRDAGADVKLRPKTSRGGEADFELTVGGVTHIVEASGFPNDAFASDRFRVAPIVRDVVESRLGEAFRVKTFLQMTAWPKGNAEAKIRDVITKALSEYRTSLNAVSVSNDWATVRVETLDADANYNPLEAADEESKWDVCLRHVQKRLREGSPLYRLDRVPVEAEIGRVYVKYPPDNETRSIYDSIAKKLKKEAKQLAGTPAPRIVILDTTRLGDVFQYSQQAVEDALKRILFGMPSVACVWLTMRKWTTAFRHKYYSLYIPNDECAYQLPRSFLKRYADREWKWDHIAGLPVDPMSESAARAAYTQRGGMFT